MKNKINYSYVMISLCLSLLLPYIPWFRQNEGNIVKCGFPYHFFSVHFNSLGEAAVHFDISSFLLNALLIYLLIALISFGVNRAAGRKKDI